MPAPQGRALLWLEWAPAGSRVRVDHGEIAEFVRLGGWREVGRPTHALDTIKVAKLCGRAVEVGYRVTFDLPPELRCRSSWLRRSMFGVML